MKAHPPHTAPSDWAIDHPWLYIYTAIAGDLAILLFFTYLIDYLKGILP